MVVPPHSEITTIRPRTDWMERQTCKWPHFHCHFAINKMAGVTGRSGSLLPSDAPARLSPTRGSTASRLTGTTSHARALASTSAAAGAAGASRSGTASSAAASTTGTGIDYLDAAHGTGCLVCGLDNDHANILLCERCNDEYHTYCLRPALNSVPDGDWFCGECDQVLPAITFL